MEALLEANKSLTTRDLHDTGVRTLCICESQQINLDKVISEEFIWEFALRITINVYFSKIISNWSISSHCQLQLICYCSWKCHWSIKKIGGWYTCGLWCFFQLIVVFLSLRYWLSSSFFSLTQKDSCVAWGTPLGKKVWHGHISLQGNFKSHEFRSALYSAGNDVYRMQQITKT